MSQIINLPPSLNLGDIKQTALEDMRPSFQRLRAQNQTYKPRDCINIPIPTGKKGDYLIGSDSYISFKFKGTFDDASGAISLDGTAYSFFKNVRVRHGSNQLVNQRNANRLYNALYDIQVNPADRVSDTTSLCLDNSSTALTSLYLYGRTLTTGTTYDASFTLPVPLVGSLSEKATPIGWMNTSQLFIEIDLEDANKVFTSRTGATIQGADGTAIGSITEYEITEVYYHAKIVQIGAMYDDLLLNSLGQNIMIPGVDWVGDEGQVAQGANINHIFSFPFSSCKMFMWWLTNTSTGNGTIDSSIYRSAITQRQSGDLKEYCLSLNGQQFPPTPIYCSGSKYAVCMQELLRCFNLNSSVSKGGVLDQRIYTVNTTTKASDSATKRFVGGLDLDRCDNENSRLFSGLNSINSQVALNVAFDNAPGEAQTVFAFMHFDSAYILQDGLLSVQK